MAELDRMLLRYVEVAYPAAEEAERRNFEGLLELDDNLLWSYLIGYLEPAEPDVSRLTTKIRKLASHRT
ncbi:MAG TPA: succinate dehydrogenase assembly factor 2 [Methylococcus sp.]|nr:succinate dehydrogenase assembly factor 2 [Methylococcus sp.]